MPTHYPLVLFLFAGGFGHWMHCGTNVERVILPGDNVTLQCDCSLTIGWDIRWVRGCTPLVQPMAISSYESLIRPIPRYSVGDRSYSLTIENITESDLGFYYCAKVKTKLSYDEDSKVTDEDIYRICNTSTKLSFEAPPVASVTSEKDCVQCWLILLTVCPACTILSALLSSVCVFCCCRKTVAIKHDDNPINPARRRQNGEEQTEDTQVYYASLNIPKNTSKRTKRNPSVNPDFSVYSQLNKEQT